MKTKIIIAVIILALAGALYAYITRTQEVTVNPVVPGRNDDSIFCTADAKQCPDGSYVGRVAPSCEFAPCPSGASVETNINL